MLNSPPIIDLHCDLLSYLQLPGSDPFNTNDIGCAIPWLKKGNVRFQVMAIFNFTEKGSGQSAIEQSRIFKNLFTDYNDHFKWVQDSSGLTDVEEGMTGAIASIENASGICEEDESLKDGFNRLEQIIENTQRILYISLTHHEENRFGGGNYSTAGLKDDGKALLDYIAGRKIAIDLSHTSDALASGILDHLEKSNLDVPVMASHSNFREVHDHARNLPDEIAKEIISRKGIIGINFVRAFVGDSPDALYQHIIHGYKLGGENAICFGADFFHAGNHPDPARIPFFYKEHENASCFPVIQEALMENHPSVNIDRMAFGNATAFLQRLWLD